MEQIIETQKESVKLMKMSKGYNWEIKLLGRDEDDGELKEEHLKRLEEIDKSLREKYGDEKKEIII